MATASRAQRMKDAMQESRLSIRGDIVPALQAKGLKGKGASRQMIHRYLSDDGPEPPPELLRGLAEILGIRYEWLDSGELPKRPADDRLTHERGDIIEKFFDEFPVLRESGVADPLASAWRRYAATSPEPLDDEQLLSLGLALYSFITLPGELWGMELPDETRGIEDYASAMMHALKLVMLAPGQAEVWEWRGALDSQGDGVEPTYSLVPDPEKRARMAERIRADEPLERLRAALEKKILARRWNQRRGPESTIT